MKKLKIMVGLIFVLIAAVFMVQNNVLAMDVAQSKQTTLKVTSNITEAQVLLDGRNIGTAPIEGHILAPGNYIIRVEKDGYESFQQRITISPGRTGSVYALLRSIQPRSAHLWVNPIPSDARVRILNIGPRYTPGIELLPGRYHIEVTAAGYENHLEWIEVAGGEDKIMAVPLLKTRVETPVQPLSSQPATSEPFRAGNKQAVTVKGVTFNMVYIPAGEYLRGSPENEPGRDKIRETQHRVRITKAFWMGETEVTQGLWQAVMGYNPSHFKACGSDCPVEMVSWNISQEFIRRLNGLVSGGGFRLPTEGEWEYAARAGTTTPFHTGNCLSTSQANYNGNTPSTGCPNGEYREKTVPVGSFAPNTWGLYDMHGNVAEFTADWFDSYRTGVVTDPKGTQPGHLASRVYRGGSWYHNDDRCRSSIRNTILPDNDFRYDFLGLRLARTH